MDQLNPFLCERLWTSLMFAKVFNRNPFTHDLEIFGFLRQVSEITEMIVLPASCSLRAINENLAQIALKLFCN